MAVSPEHIIIIELMLIVILPSSLPVQLKDTQTYSYRTPHIILVEAEVNEFIPPNPSSWTCRCRKPQVLFILAIIVPLSQPNTTLQGVRISVRNKRNMVILNIRNGMQNIVFLTLTYKSQCQKENLEILCSFSCFEKINKFPYATGAKLIDNTMTHSHAYIV